MVYRHERSACRRRLLYTKYTEYAEGLSANSTAFPHRSAPLNLVAFLGVFLHQSSVFFLSVAKLAALCSPGHRHIQRVPTTYIRSLSTAPTAMRKSGEPVSVEGPRTFQCSLVSKISKIAFVTRILRTAKKHPDCGFIPCAIRSI